MTLFSPASHHTAFDYGWITDAGNLICWRRLNNVHEEMRQRIEDAPVADTYSNRDGATWMQVPERQGKAEKYHDGKA